jgi:hypothetical protein
MKFFARMRAAMLAFPQWAASFLDPTQPRTASNLLAMLVSTGVLCWTCIRVTLALARMVEHGGHCTTADVLLLAAASLPLAALAGAVYSLKPDGSMQIGSQGGNPINFPPIQNPPTNPPITPPPKPLSGSQP